MATKREIFKNHEKFSNVAAGFQSIAIILGVIVGGVWARYTFVSLRAKEKAAAELHEFELRKRELERVNREQGVVDIEIKAKKVSLPTGPRRSIEINIQVKNIGNRNVHLEIPDYAMTVTKVHSDDNGSLHIDGNKVKKPTIPYLKASELDARKLGTDKPDKLIRQTNPELLRAGQTVTFISWCPVEEAGLYLIEFAARLTGEELTVTRLGLGIVGDNKPFHVVGQTFLVVE